MNSSTIFAQLMNQPPNGAATPSRKTRGRGRKPSAATEIVNLATSANVDLFHDPAQVAYASIPIQGHSETYAIKSKSFTTWLSRLAYKQLNKAASATAINDALNLLQGIAVFDGPEIPVETRVAGHGRNLYLDLADATWRAVEITPGGWQVVNNSPVRFRRPSGMFAIPEPKPGGTISLLRRFVNCESEASSRLIVAWLLAAVRPGLPFPVLLLRGEQGTAKSTLARLLRSLIDPNQAPLRRPPRNEHDLIIGANNGWICCYDNLSHIPDYLSDAFCCLATGGGFATRMLYSDADETIFQATRPLMLTGIGDVVTRGDLLDRCISIELDPIDDSKRMTEAEVDCEFEKFRPQNLGALLEGAVMALAKIMTTKPPQMPRMADFFQWAVAGLLRSAGNQLI